MIMAVGKTYVVASCQLDVVTGRSKSPNVHGHVGSGIRLFLLLCIVATLLIYAMSCVVIKPTNFISFGTILGTNASNSSINGKHGL